MTAQSEVTVFGKTLPDLIRELLGDYQKVAKRACECASVQTWQRRQTWQATVPAAASMMVPPLAMPVTIPAAAAFTVRKLAHLAWGIGALKAQGSDMAPVDPEADLIGILAVWSGLRVDEVTKVVERVRGKDVPTSQTFRSALALGGLSKHSVGAVLLLELGKQLRINLWAVAGGFVWWTMHSFAKAAEQYYDHKFGLV